MWHRRAPTVFFNEWGNWIVWGTHEFLLELWELWEHMGSCLQSVCKIIFRWYRRRLKNLSWQLTSQQLRKRILCFVVMQNFHIVCTLHKNTCCGQTMQVLEKSDGDGWWSIIVCDWSGSKYKLKEVLHYDKPLSDFASAEEIVESFFETVRTSMRKKVDDVDDRST